MSQKSRRDRKQGRAARHGKDGGRLWYVLGGVGAVLVVVAMAIFNHWADPHKHPVPRSDDVPVSRIVPAERYEAYPRVAETYRMVAAVPQVIDGIFCYCMCADHSGHYSLLDCFFSDHAARCDVCLSEATMAYRMSRDGRDLDAIRAEIDGRFRS